MTPFLGQIISVGFNFAPVGWHLCDGSIVSISQYSALYQLLGTTYGGDGINTFGLPDLRGRAPLGMGTGTGQPTYVQGQLAGTESVTLTAGQAGAHAHTLVASTKAGSATNPGATLALGQSPASVPVYLAPGSPAPPMTPLAAAAIGASGGALPHENRQPFLALTYIIALEGVWPSQS